eukprot:Rhum_TRINITY_DN3879_c0_g1::Rhum_TRINITY_DN3879_c0_g1_i1::g.12316::m.12316
MEYLASVIVGEVALEGQWGTTPPRLWEALSKRVGPIAADDTVRRELWAYLCNLHKEGTFSFHERDGSGAWTPVDEPGARSWESVNAADTSLTIRAAPQVRMHYLGMEINASATVNPQMMRLHRQAFLLLQCIARAREPGIVQSTMTQVLAADGKADHKDTSRILLDLAKRSLICKVSNTGGQHEEQKRPKGMKVFIRRLANRKLWPNFYSLGFHHTTGETVKRYQVQHLVKRGTASFVTAYTEQMTEDTVLTTVLFKQLMAHASAESLAMHTSAELLCFKRGAFDPELEAWVRDNREWCITRQDVRGCYTSLTRRSAAVPEDIVSGNVDDETADPMALPVFESRLRSPQVPLLQQTLRNTLERSPLGFPRMCLSQLGPAKMVENCGNEARTVVQGIQSTTGSLGKVQFSVMHVPAEVAAEFRRLTGYTPYRDLTIFPSRAAEWSAASEPRKAGSGTEARAFLEQTVNLGFSQQNKRRDMTKGLYNTKKATKYRRKHLAGYTSIFPNVGEAKSFKPGFKPAHPPLDKGYTFDLEEDKPTKMERVKYWGALNTLAVQASGAHRTTAPSNEDLPPLDPELEKALLDGIAKLAQEEDLRANANTVVQMCTYLQRIQKHECVTVAEVRDPNRNNVATKKELAHLIAMGLIESVDLDLDLFLSTEKLTVYGLKGFDREGRAAKGCVTRAKESALARSARAPVDRRRTTFIEDLAANIPATTQSQYDDLSDEVLKYIWMLQSLPTNRLLDTELQTKEGLYEQGASGKLVRNRRRLAFTAARAKVFLFHSIKNGFISPKMIRLRKFHAYVLGLEGSSFTTNALLLGMPLSAFSQFAGIRVPIEDLVGKDCDRSLPIPQQAEELQEYVFCRNTPGITARKRLATLFDMLSLLLVLRVLSIDEKAAPQRPGMGAKLDLGVTYHVHTSLDLSVTLTEGSAQVLGSKRKLAFEVPTSESPAFTDYWDTLSDIMLDESVPDKEIPALSQLGPNIRSATAWEGGRTVTRACVKALRVFLRNNDKPSYSPTDAYTLTRLTPLAFTGAAELLVSQNPSFMAATDQLHRRRKRASNRIGVKKREFGTRPKTATKRGFIDDVQAAEGAAPLAKRPRTTSDFPDERLPGAEKKPKNTGYTGVNAVDMFHALACKAMMWKKAGKKVSGTPKLTAKGLIVVNSSELAAASKELGMPPKVLRARWKYFSTKREAMLLSRLACIAADYNNKRSFDRHDGLQKLLLERYYPRFGPSPALPRKYSRLMGEYFFLSAKTSDQPPERPMDPRVLLSCMEAFRVMYMTPERLYHTELSSALVARYYTFKAFNAPLLQETLMRFTSRSSNNVFVQNKNAGQSRPFNLSLTSQMCLQPQKCPSLFFSEYEKLKHKVKDVDGFVPYKVVEAGQIGYIAEEYSQGTLGLTASTTTAENPFHILQSADLGTARSALGLLFTLRSSATHTKLARSRLRKRAAKSLTNTASSVTCWAKGVWDASVYDESYESRSPFTLGRKRAHSEAFSYLEKDTVASVGVAVADDDTLGDPAFYSFWREAPGRAELAPHAKVLRLCAAAVDAELVAAVALRHFHDAGGSLDCHELAHEALADAAAESGEWADLLAAMEEEEEEGAEGDVCAPQQGSAEEEKEDLPLQALVDCAKDDCVQASAGVPLVDALLDSLLSADATREEASVVLAASDSQRRGLTVAFPVSAKVVGFLKKICTLVMTAVEMAGSDGSVATDVLKVVRLAVADCAPDASEDLVHTVVAPLADTALSLLHAAGAVVGLPDPTSPSPCVDWVYMTHEHGDLHIFPRAAVLAKAAAVALDERERAATKEVLIVVAALVVTATAASEGLRRMAQTAAVTAALAGVVAVTVDPAAREGASEFQEARRQAPRKRAGGGQAVVFENVNRPMSGLLTLHGSLSASTIERSLLAMYDHLAYYPGSTVESLRKALPLHSQMTIRLLLSEGLNQGHFWEKPCPAGYDKAPVRLRMSVHNVPRDRCYFAKPGKAPRVTHPEEQ